MKLLILGAEDLRSALPMETAIEAMKEAYAQFSSGDATVPLRERIPLEDPEGVILFMPAYLHESGELAIKIVSVIPGNQKVSLPIIHALVIAFDAKTGEPLAIIEGASLTALRTGAASGAATDLLAREDAARVAIIGSGTQARTQLEAVCISRKIESVTIYSLDKEEGDAFAAEVAGKQEIPDDIVVTKTAQNAVEGADIICTATTSSTPVFTHVDVAPGTHINAIGSYTSEMQEIDALTMLAAKVFVDSREAVLAETGDIIRPIEDGLFDSSHISAELGEVVLGNKAGRDNDEQITLFKSVGIAVQDAIAAGMAIKHAMEMGLGTFFEIE